MARRIEIAKAIPISLIGLMCLPQLLAQPQSTVRLEFEGNKFATIFVPVKDESVTIQKQIPAKPRNVVLGPEHSLLANIRKE